MDQRDLVRRQFGANAANYATSPVHAKGASLKRLVEVLEPRPKWQALDIATAAGHTAFALAPEVAEVLASDITPEMLDVARAEAAERGLSNVRFELADAESLPFDDASFDAVTCRIAPHHFPNPDRFIAEAARVLRTGGVFGLVDNVVPDDLEVATFTNDWERKRDPSHLMALSVDAWLELMSAAGFTIRHSELMAKRMVFSTWADNMAVAPELRASLLHDLETAPEPVAAFLRPELGDAGDEEPAAFFLTECVIVGVKG